MPTKWEASAPCVTAAVGEDCSPVHQHCWYLIPRLQPLIPLRVKKPAGFYFVFFPPEPGFMEPVGGNRSVLARLCHQCSVAKHTHQLWHYNCEIRPLPYLPTLSVSSIWAQILNCQSGKVLWSQQRTLLLLHVELSREEPSQGRFSFPFSSPFPLHHVPPDGLFHGQLMLETGTSQAQFSSLRHRAQGWTGGRHPTHQAHFVVTIDCSCFYSSCYSLANLSEGLKVWPAVSVCIIYLWWFCHCLLYIWVYKLCKC